MSYADAPIPNNPEAKFANWRMGMEERMYRQESSGIFVPVFLHIRGGQLTSGYISSGNNTTTPTPVYIAGAPQPYYDAIEVIATIGSPAGTSGRARLEEKYSGNTTSESVIASGDTLTIRWRWLHGVDTNSAVPNRVEFQLQTRYASGTAASVSAFNPDWFMMAPAEVLEGASSTGNATVI